jgi:hypothetical protein
VADNTGVNQQIMLVVIDAIGEGARDIVGPKPKGEMTAQQFVEPAAGMGDECSRSVTGSGNAALVISSSPIRLSTRRFPRSGIFNSGRPPRDIE